MPDQDTSTAGGAGTAPEDTTQDTTEAPQGDQNIQGDPTPRRGASDDLKADLVKERRQRQALEKRLKDIEDRDLTELQRAQKTAQDATTRLQQLETESLRTRVALKAGIPAEHIHRLQGSTEDELAADAADLAKLLAPRAPKPDPSQGSKASSRGPVDMNDAIRQAAGYR